MVPLGICRDLVNTKSLFYCCICKTDKLIFIEEFTDPHVIVNLYIFILNRENTHSVDTCTQYQGIGSHIKAHSNLNKNSLERQTNHQKI